MDKHALQLPGLSTSSIFVLAISMPLLAGCLLAGLPVQTEQPSDHFDIKYIEAHHASTKQEVIERLGGPDTIFQFKGKTYYVYDATGDTRSIGGAVFGFPPFFFPFWTPKAHGDALHCLVVIFDANGRLQNYMAKTASEEARVGLIIPVIGPPIVEEWPLSAEVTACAEVLWNEEEVAQFDHVAQEDEIRSLETAVPGEQLSLWAYTVFGPTAEGYKWLCRAADQGSTESRALLGGVFYNETHRSRKNAVSAYVWYSLANTDDKSVPKVRLNILEELLSDDELHDAQHRLDLWEPSECMKGLQEGGLLEQGGSDHDLNGVIVSNSDFRDHEPFSERSSPQLEQMAEQGDAKAMLELFWTTSGPERLRWLCRAANQGYADAQYRIGALYEHGITGVVPQDIVRAYLWYRLAAKSGHVVADPEASELAERMTSTQLASAQSLMAEFKPEQCERDLLSYFPSDTQSDRQERKNHYEEWGLRVAAAAGDAESQWLAYRILGNTSEGYKWLCRAADQDYTAARMQLGYLYGSGAFGFKQDYTRSYLWYRLAGAGKLSGAVEEAIKKVEKRRLACTEGQVCFIAERIVELKGLLGTEGLSRADQLVREWKPNQCELELVLIPAELERSDN